MFGFTHVYADLSSVSFGYDQQKASGKNNQGGNNPRALHRRMTPSTHPLRERR